MYSKSTYEYKRRKKICLEDINNVEGIERIRLGSIEPLLISEEFVCRLKKLNKIFVKEAESLFFYAVFYRKNHYKSFFCSFGTNIVSIFLFVIE